ncbi:MAG TPA: sporulation protein YabP [Bacillota bacterium]|nr:sporulation protein YabP [Bacillota bacterium]
MTIENFQRHVGQPVTKEHEMKMINRSELELTGVKEIDSFDHAEFLIETVMGYLIVRGDNLQLKNLDVNEGLLNITGTIHDITYLDDHMEKAKGFFSKLFK